MERRWSSRRAVAADDGLGGGVSSFGCPARGSSAPRRATPVGMHFAKRLPCHRWRTAQIAVALPRRADRASLSSNFARGECYYRRPMSPPGPLRHRFSRRSLLRGLGAGTVLLAPFVRDRFSTAQAAPAGNLIIFYTPNGHKRGLVVDNQRTLCFDAAQAPGHAGQAVGGLTLGRSLMPLQPLQNDVAVIKGLNLKSPTFIASHQDICRILTCWGDPHEGNNAGQFAAFGPSIDQTIGAAFNQRPVVVAVDPYRDVPHWRTVLSWSASGVNAPFTKDHQAVFNDLFGALTGAGETADQVAALARTRARNASLLDFVRSDVATFRTRVNSDDRAHLDSYLDALQSLEQRVAQEPALPLTCAPSSLEARLAALPAMAPVQVDDKSAGGVVAEMQARGELWMDMIATAFACGTRRVAVIQWQGASEGYNPADDLGSPNHHSVTEGAASADHWVAIDTWYANRFAYQLTALKHLGVLDRTIVAWVSEITEGHNQLNMVTVVGGGRALGMKTGQYVQYPFTGKEVEGSESIPTAQDPTNKSLSDLWVTIQQALGVDEPTFGDPKWSAGPLVELRG
jgi:hypothetical protein